MIKEIYYKYRYRVIFPITILLTIVNFITLYFVLNITPVSNDECLWVQQKDDNGLTRIYFDFVKFQGVSWEAGIRDGDILLAINDIDLENNNRASMVLNSIPEGHYAKYKIERDGEIIETKVYVKKLIDFNSLSFCLLAIFWLLVGFVVLKANPEGRSQILFFRIGVLFSLTALVGILSGPAATNPVRALPLLFAITGSLWYFGIIYLPFFIVQFFWVFPNKMGIMQKKITRKILYYTPTIIFAITIVLVVIGNIFEINLPGFGIFNRILLLAVNIAMVIGLISLFVNYSRLKTKKERNSIFIILISYFIGVLAMVYTYLLAGVIADTIFNSPAYFMPIILISLLPIAFGYSIFRYSLMDVSDVFKNAIIYGTATLGIAGIYFAVIYLIGYSVSSVVESDYQGAITAGIFILFALIFQSTKDKFQALLTQKFYPEQFLYQKVLVRFSNEINAIIGLDNILDEMHGTLVDSLKLEHFGILLKSDNYFELKRSRGFNDASLKLLCDEKIILEYFQDKKDKKLPLAVERNDFSKLFPDDGFKLEEEEIFTLVPMIIKSKIIGFILFGLKYSGSQFAGKDLQLLIAAANQASVSIENARLYESEAQKMKIDRDLENAKKIQESLLPKCFPFIEGLKICGDMIPAMQVGGDYYDLIQVSDKKMFVVVGDVSGKGLAASFYMTQLQTMMRLFCTSEKSPKEILIEVNKRIYENIDRNWFITISLALFDTETNKIKFCRAGHTPLMISNNGNVQTLTPKGIGVGLEKGDIFNSSLEEIEFEYKEGCQFLFFSDGITEEMDPKQELFGEERLKNVLLKSGQNDVAVTMSDILNSVKDFRNGTPQNDDITLVLVKAD